MSFEILEHFELTKTEKIKENQTKVYFYTHKKTKASVLFFDNPNENAGFSTFFRTPCSNSKGTTHILEHSVFEGSRNYNQENSLDFILNNSLNSAFNAMTFLDKTGYYFCSSFQKDYLNLLDIYLDFIYFPKLELKTLRKEGHFLKKTSKGYEFNGIVFNEMKNSLLGFNSKFYDSISNFFEKGSYSYISGGNPVDVVDLTHEELTKYHSDHYHPTNSFTILYGKINKKKVFEKLNEVFSEFEQAKSEIKIDVNPINKNQNLIVEYQNNNEENDINFSKYYLQEDIVTEEDYLSLDLTKNYLLNYDFSPLRRIIEDSKLCTSLEDIYLSEAKFPVLAVLCRGVEEKNIKKLEELIDKSLIKFSKKVSKEIKDLLLRRYEFRLNEIEFYQNQAEDTMFSAARFLNYNLDPLIGLRNFTSLKKIKRILRGRGLEKFMTEKLIKSKTLSIIFKPNKNLLNIYNQELNQKLADKLSKIDNSKLDKDIEEHENFLNSEKKEPKYPSLKKIKLQDLNLKIKKYDYEIKDKFFISNLNSGEIVRLNLNFDISQFDFKKIKTLGIYLVLINQISTKNFKFDELSFQKKKIFDRISFNISGFYDYHKKKQYSIFYLASSFMNSDFQNASELFNEIIKQINFQDKNRIKFLLQEHLDSLKESIQENALENSLMIAQSYLSPTDAISFNLNSLPLMKELKRILAEFDNNYDELAEELQNIHKYLFSQNCLVQLGLSSEIKDTAVTKISHMIKNLDIKTTDKNDFKNLNTEFFSEPASDLNLFYEANSDTNFNVMGIKYNHFESKDSGIIRILEPYMFQYLWENIRVKNGAYGAFWTLNRNYEYGVFGSYSDPKVNETYQTYLNTKKNYDLTKFKNYSYEKMKLKFLSKEKVILRNSNLFANSFSLYIRGVADSEREKVLAHKIELKFSDFKELFKNINNYKYVVKVIATSKELIGNFKEKYQSIDLN